MAPWVPVEWDDTSVCVSLVEVVVDAVPNLHSSAMYFFDSRVARVVPVSVMELDTAD